MYDMNINERQGTTSEFKKAPHEEQRQMAGVKTGRLWTAVALLALVLAGAIGYGYLTERKNNLELVRLPDMQSSIQGLGQRLGSAETGLNSLTGGWQGFVTQVSTLEGRVSRNLQAARKQALELGAQMGQIQDRVQAQLQETSQKLQARLDGLESRQDAEQGRVARLQEQVASLQQELASARQNTGRDIADLRQDVSKNEQEVGSLAQQIARERLEFEAVKNRTQEIVPGVSLFVSKTNVSYQRFDGRLWLLEDRRTVWFRGRSVQQALVFYSKQNRAPYELVVTRVSKDGVVGYLVRPVAQSTSAASLTAPEPPATQAEAVR